MKKKTPFPESLSHEKEKTEKLSSAKGLDTFLCFSLCKKNELPNTKKDIESLLGVFQFLGNSGNQTRGRNIHSLKNNDPRLTHLYKKIPDNTKVMSIDVGAGGGRGKNRSLFFYQHREGYRICKMLSLFTDKTHKG